MNKVDHQFFAEAIDTYREDADSQTAWIRKLQAAQSIALEESHYKEESVRLRPPLGSIALGELEHESDTEEPEYYDVSGVPIEIVAMAERMPDHTTWLTKRAHSNRDKASRGVERSRRNNELVNDVLALARRLEVELQEQNDILGVNTDRVAEPGRTSEAIGDAILSSRDK